MSAEPGASRPGFTYQEPHRDAASEAAFIESLQARTRRLGINNPASTVHELTYQLFARRAVIMAEARNAQ
ncbi:hypothetical protein WJX72_009869 [[Myrmecia] bisecta]|uniref:Uncharacterized protein n=1 Tax=[Myrmecia] bisecta TaxID=41462 RepID=A0AAW1PZ58_9CHLO